MTDGPLRKVETREYRERLSCGHTISWTRPGPGTGGEDWPKLVQKRRCAVCAQPKGHTAYFTLHPHMVCP